MSGDLGPDVRLLLERSAAVAEQTGAAESAATLRAELGRPAATMTAVVVVGETKRGKSSLINALLDRAGLLPVDADVATNVHLAIGYATRAHGRVTTDDRSFDVPLAAIGDYASVSGNPDNHRSVRAVEVRLDHSLLAKGLTLVDTPGVGGLEAGHSAITLAQLRYADALLFVLDAAAPITRSELQFLLEATKRIETVFFVLTKTDAFPEWRAILQENLTALAEHVPRYKDSPFLPVSSVLKARADEAARLGDMESAERLRQQSGVGAILYELDRRVVSRAEALRLSNLCRLAATVLEELERSEQLRRRSATADPTLLAELETEKDRYADLAKAEARWRADLSAMAHGLQLDLNRELARSLAEVRTKAEAKIERADESLYATLPRDVSDDLEGRWIELNSFLDDRVLAIVSGLAEAFPLEGMRVTPQEQLPVPARLREPGGVRPSLESDDNTLLAKVQLLYPGVMSALGIRALWVWALPAAAPALPICMLGGVLVQTLFLKQRRRAAARMRTQSDARRFVNEILPAAQTEMTIELQRRLADVRRAIEDEVGARLLERKDQLTAAITAHQTVLRTAQAERTRALTRATKNLSLITELLALSAQCRQRLAAAAVAGDRQVSAAAETPAGPAEMPATLRKVTDSWIDDS